MPRSRIAKSRGKIVIADKLVIALLQIAFLPKVDPFEPPSSGCRKSIRENMPPKNEKGLYMPVKQRLLALARITADKVLTGIF